MIRQWITNFKMIGPIECTALVTRIALRLGVLSGTPVPFIGMPRVLIDEAYFIQGHILKRGPNDSLTFFFPGYANQIPLPNPGFGLYNSESLTIPLVTQEESRHASVLGRSTGARRREHTCSSSSHSRHHHALATACYTTSGRRGPCGVHVRGYPWICTWLGPARLPAECEWHGLGECEQGPVGYTR